MQLAKTQEANLRRYLERAAGQGVRDPGRDLLYLEPAGAAAGLDDVTLGETVEMEAPERPQAVIDELRERPDEERGLVAEVLADMADNEFGVERSNVMTALLGVVELIGDLNPKVAERISQSLAGFLAEQPLAPDQLVGALIVGLAAPSSGQLVEKLLADAQLFEDAERAEKVAALLDDIPEKFRPEVHEGIRDRVAESPELVQPGIESLSADVALSLLTSEPVTSGIHTALAQVEEEEEGEERGEEVAEFADGLYESALKNTPLDPRLTQAVQHVLIAFDSESAVYPVVKSRAETVMPTAPDREAADLDAMRGIIGGLPGDWPFWAEWLSGIPDETDPEQQTSALLTLKSVLGLLREQDPETQEGGVEAIGSLVPYLSNLSAEETEDLTATLRGVLGAAGWWDNDDELADQTRIHAICRTLQRVSPQMEADMRGLVVEDVRRGLVPAPPQDPTWVRPPTLRGLRTLGASLDQASAEDVLTTLVELGTTGAPDQDLDVAHARSVLAKRTAEKDPSVVDHQVLIAAAERDADGFPDAMAAWLELDPDTAVVRQVIVAEGEVMPAAVEGELGNWAGRLSQADRTALIEAMVALDGDYSDWVDALSGPGIDEKSMTTLVLNLIKGAATTERREELVGTLVALDPQTPAGQKGVADVIVYLLRTGKAVDFQTALAAAPALGTEHRSSERIKKALKKAADDKSHRVSKREDVQAFHDAGIDLPKKTLTDRAKKFGKTILGG